MKKFVGVYNGDDSHKVNFSIVGEMTEENVIGTLNKLGYGINTSYYTKGTVYLTDDSVVVEWDNGSELNAYEE